MVNLVCFYLLRRAKTGLQTANVISIITAILFAYIVNSRFVFRDAARGFKEHIVPFLKFISARASTMVIEVGGVWFLVEKLRLGDMVGKILTQFVVLVLNYVFSKFLVFTTGAEKKG